MAARRNVPNTGKDVLKDLLREEKLREEMYKKATSHKKKGAFTQGPALIPSHRSKRAVQPRNTPDTSGQEESNYGDALFYDPTPTINPDRPRTLRAGYNPDTQTLHVEFRDGTMWNYYGVPWDVWMGFFRAPSPGRYINSVLNNYEYGPA
jgi:hypothetical protein